MSVFYLYLGAASAVCAFQWALATLDAPAAICASGSA
ncbi:hypothetical protein SBADM41S_03000 [Streptomyces badius]